MKRFIEKHLYDGFNFVSTLIISICIVVICITVFIAEIVPMMSQIIASTDVLSFSNSWMQVMLFEMVFGVIVLGVLADSWAYCTKRTDSVLMFFNYIIGGIMFGFIAGTIGIIVFTKILGVHLYNLYLFVPLFGSWCGIAAGIILHWKPQKE